MCPLWPIQSEQILVNSRDIRQHLVTALRLSPSDFHIYHTIKLGQGSENKRNAYRKIVDRCNFSP